MVAKDRSYMVNLVGFIRIDSKRNQKTNIAPLDCVKCTKLWFKDGNIVLIVKSTAFRVYRGVLAAVSPVFSDMFAAPRLLSGDRVDGCPVVRLDDAVEDMTNFLQVLFEYVC